MEWILPGDEETSLPPDCYIISFMHFHKHGLVIPTHRFLWGLLHYYRSSRSISTPTGSCTWWPLSRCVKDFWGSNPTSTYGGTFHRQSIEEEGKGLTKPTHANGVRKHPSPEQPGWRVHVLAAIVIQQRVTQVVVLFEERHYRPLAGVLQTPNRGGTRAVGVGSSKQGQEEYQ
jgi:hypothetical protein